MVSERMINPLDAIRTRPGRLAKIAYGLGITRGAVAKWKRIPAERVLDVERITGIPRYELRPDLYPSPRS